MYDNDNNVEAACIKIIDSQTEEDSWAKVEKPQKKTEIRDEKVKFHFFLNFLLYIYWFLRIRTGLNTSLNDHHKMVAEDEDVANFVADAVIIVEVAVDEESRLEDNQRTDLNHVTSNHVNLKVDSHGTVGAAVAVEVDNVADEVVDSEVVLNHQEIKETTETMDEISDQGKYHK